MIPFELTKEDLGDYSEDPEKYIRAFKGVTLLYDLTWKDVMYIVGQMLTPDSKTRGLGKAVAYGDEWLGNESVGKREDNITALPTGKQAVPNTEPDWDYNTAKGRWDQSHYVRCILQSESALDCKEIQAVHPKGDQSWVFIGRTGAQAETPVLWPPHAKS